MPDDGKTDSKTDAPSSAAAAKRSRRPLAIVGAIAVAVALGIGGVALAHRHQETTGDAPNGADVVHGAARVGGRVLRGAVAENAVVKKGDLILEIDPADLVVKQKAAQADLEAAKAQAAVADAQIRIADATSKGGLS